MAYLRAWDKVWRSTLTAYVSERGGTPQQRLLATFGALRDWLRERNPRGCAFVNAHVELPEDHPGQEVAREQKAWLLDYLGNLAAEASAQDPGSLAGQLLALHEGACIINSMHSLDEAARRAGEMAAILMEAALAPLPASAGGPQP